METLAISTGTGDSICIFQESFNSTGWGVIATPRNLFRCTARCRNGGARFFREIAALSAEEVEAILASTAVDLGASGWDQFYGAGRVDAAAAVAAAQPLPSTDAAYVLGGSAAVSASVATDIGWTIGASPTRLEGLDRYATAVSISKEFHSSEADTVYVVTGESFPDALGIGPVAAIAGAPILLVNRTSVPASTAR